MTQAPRWSLMQPPVPRIGISAKKYPATKSLIAGRPRCTEHYTTCRRGRYAARAGPARRRAGGIGHGITPRSISRRTDDLYDCGLDTDFEVTIPEGMASGVYGVRLAVAASRTSCRSMFCHLPV